MIRIYISDDEIEGYHEGCGCCSSTEHASLADIKTLVKELDKQKEELAILGELIEEYGESQVVCWWKEHNELLTTKMAVEAAQQYEKTPDMEGTYYKECYENMAKNIRILNEATKRYKKSPSVFKKYIKMRY